LASDPGLYWAMTRRTSVSTRLFVLVFGFSVAWFTLTTGIQMVFEYRSTRASLDASLEDLFLATRAGLDSALWSYDMALVHQSLDEIRSVRYLSGALIFDEKGAIVDSWGSVPSMALAAGPIHNVDELSGPLYHRFGVSHVDSKGVVRALGQLVLSADFPVLWTLVGDRIRLIVSNYLASTLGLMVILLVGLRWLVNQPLGRITRAIEDYRFDRAGFVPPEPLARRNDELTVLWKSFESLTLVLKESWLQQRVMAAIFEEAAVMALVCDDRGTVVSSNAQARARLADGVPGGFLHRLAYGSESAPLLADSAALLATGSSWRGQVTVQGDRGSQYWLSVALLPLQVADQPQARWGVLIEDVSAQRLNDLYRRERDLAREAARNKSLFLANLSHEIRTPMNAVMGLTALVQDEEVSPRAREYLTQLQRSGTALLGVINDILDFSKLEEGKVSLESVEFRIDEVLGAIDALCRYQAQDKGLSLSVRVAPRLPGLLRGDPLRVRQVLTNLVSNAVKFTDHGAVDVAALPGSPGRVRFEVRDSGIGISPEDQERLFQSFTQVDPSTTRKYGGTGLGLAICRQLVGLMGGTLGVQSEVGKGSVFWFELPGLVVAAGAPTEGLAGLRVLLAEDNKVNQLVAREILAKAGIQPVIVSNGRQAVEAASSQTFDLVLMDLQMPVMDGLEAVRLLRQTFAPEALPVLAMTAHTFAQERQTCLEAGMQDLVPKPVDPAQLYGMLSRWRPAGSTA